MPHFNLDELVFIDECGVSIDLIRLYGRSITILEMFCCAQYTETHRHSSQSNTFGRYNSLQKMTFLWTNLSIHKVEWVEKLALSANALPLYLPSYSLGLNPIEKMWSKMKTFVHKWKIRDVKILRNAIRAAIFKIVTFDCLG